MSGFPYEPFMSSINRRTFIDRSLKGAGVTLVASSVGRSLTAAPQESRKIGYALVGLGNYSTHQLAPALKETVHSKLAGIVTGSPRKIPNWKVRHGLADAHIYNYENFDSIADDSAIDVVYVVLPNSMHKEYTIRAAEAGKHVLCEKPMALNAAECREMIAACKANGVFLGMGYRLHYEPHHRLVKDFAKGEKLGVPTYFQGEFAFRIGGPGQWRLKKELAGGGAMMDVGVYCVQGARYAFGEEPVAVRAQEFKTDPVKFAEVDETISWQMEFPSGAVANCTTSYNARTNRLYVSYENGVVEIEPAYGYGGIQGRINFDKMEFPAVNQQAIHMDAFALEIMEGRPPAISGEEGLRDMVVIDALYESIQNHGKRITL